MRQITASRAKTSEGIPIGELSRMTGVNIETIRYYEKIKMLPVPLRTDGGHRVYGPKETRTLAFTETPGSRCLSFVLMVGGYMSAQEDRQSSGRVGFLGMPWHVKRKMEK